MLRSLEWGANQVTAAVLLLQQLHEETEYWSLGAEMIPKARADS